MNYYTELVCEDISDFDSGYAVFNEYLNDSGDSAVIHYIYSSETEKLVGYYSLLATAFVFGEPEKLYIVPAIEIKMFSLDKRYQKTGITSVLLDEIVASIRLYVRQYIGAKIILLYSVPVDGVMKLYENSGFKRFTSSLPVHKSPFNEGCIAMFKMLKD